MKRRLLLVHDAFTAPGGGNAVGAWALQALRESFDVTLLAWAPPDLERINAVYGTALRAGDFRFERCNSLLGIIMDRLPFSLQLLRYGILQRHARALLRHADFAVVVGTVNELDVQQPALQYVHFPWGYFPRPETDLRWYHPLPLVRLYRKLVFAMCGLSRRRIAANPTLANSAWTARHFERWYGVRPRVLFPPVHVRTAERRWDERTNTFACVGRLSPEKRIVELIDVLSDVRRRGHDVSMLICAQRDDSAYELRVRSAVERHAGWVTLKLDAPRETLLERIASCKYGIHGMIGEHFGLAVAEMLRLGCICFAPADGGPAEILDGDDRLLYTSDRDASAKICALLDDSALQEEVRERCRASAARFSVEAFMTDLHTACHDLAEARTALPSDMRRRSRAARSWLKRVLPNAALLAFGRVYRVAYPWWKRIAGPQTQDVTTPTGHYRLPLDAPHDYVAAAIRKGIIFEADVVSLALVRIRPGDTVIDVGSNFGQMAVAFSHAVGAAGHVVAIEANPRLIPLLEYNLRANGCTNARTIFAAAYRESGSTLRFPPPRFWRWPSYGSYGVDPRARRGTPVPTVALDDLDLPVPVGFIKIDTQGCDLDVLRGARRLIARWRMPIIFEYEPEYDATFGTSFADYESFIAEVGYRVIEHCAQNFLIETA
ncbi:MAG TPA: FkbM family methyltransferase [Candidatus Baltobacteraceae bacterium]|nr:FkbM family methyltransferase [Candidatus Baltobacteraceae bacterium]